MINTPLVMPPITNPFVGNPLHALRLWFARWLLPSDHQAVPTVPLKEIEERLVGLHRRTFTSGHLTRAYHVGRIVRQETEAALDALLLAQGRTGAEFNDSYASPLMRRLYGDGFTANAALAARSPYLYFRAKDTEKTA